MHTQLNEALIQLKLANYNQSLSLKVFAKDSKMINTNDQKSKVVSLSQNTPEIINDRFIKTILNSSVNIFKRRRSA